MLQIHQYNFQYTYILREIFENFSKYLNVMVSIFDVEHIYILS